ncbi:MAG: hypothetical protein PWP03_15 [Candidatus Woesearchaeota archaeon]|nr:hypothetical protein [Candidatus Woesearchaeota archaeon]MDN5327377.1 hypothetical protein [Candidatus Woesearchaeota archaeon]
MSSLEHKLTEIFRYEQKIHSKAQLVDYYKLYLQAVEGPRHLLNAQQDKVKKYLESEVNQIDVLSDTNPDFQDLTLSNKLDYVRVNLSFVKKNHIDLDTFFEILVNSALKSLHAETSYFKQNLNLFWKLASLILDITEYNQQRQELMQMISSDFIPHHSEIYIKTYNPHYRVVSKEVWNLYFGNEFHLEI